MNPTDLIDSARQRAGGVAPFPRGRPRQTDLQRAVSDAYYAMFHALATCGANTLVGTGYAARRQPEWRQIYRALEHNTVTPGNNAATTGRSPNFQHQYGGSAVISRIPSGCGTWLTTTLIRG